MRVVVFGYGPVGKAVVARLMARGDDVVVAQRNQPQDLQRARFTACDILDPTSVGPALGNASQIVLAVGFPYISRVWKTAWPKAIANVLQSAAIAKARVVFVDNLYMYGPQRTPLREDMALTHYGRKPRVRADITRLWQSANDVCFAALRASDFYGPGVTQSHLGEQAFGALARGKAAMFVVSPDILHDFAYVPDIARAVASLLDASDDAYGQAWHVPCAPITTPRRILELGAAAIGAKSRAMVLPSALAPIIGAFSPMVAEMSEMRFQWKRPYVVDASKFSKRFWSDATPFEIGACETARSFLEHRATNRAPSAVVGAAAT